MAFELRSVFEDLPSSFLAEQRDSNCSAQKDSRDTPGRWRLLNILDLLENYNSNQQLKQRLYCSKL